MREPDPFRLRKLEEAIDESLGKCKGNQARAFRHLIDRAEKDPALYKLICDVVIVDFSRFFYRICNHLQYTTN